jgi:hypothetical protein
VSRGLTAPVNTWTLATVPHFATFPAACAAGVVAEQENIAIYDRYLGLDLPSDVRQVFESNRAASLFSHLPAFQRCASRVLGDLRPGASHPLAPYNLAWPHCHSSARPSPGTRHRACPGHP